MKKRLMVVMMALLICALLCLWVVYPVIAASECTHCGYNFTGAVGEQSRLAKALNLEVCIDCWMEAFYGGIDVVDIPNIAVLGEDGKILAEQIPEGQGGGSVNIKAGTVTTNGSGVATVTFNTPFPDTNYSISLVAVTTANTVTCMASSKTVNGFNVETEDDGGKAEPNIEVNWLATPYSNP